VEPAVSGETGAAAATEEAPESAGTAGTAGTRTAANPKLCRIYGHGSTETINTLPSFARVRACGAHGVELDVRRTTDDMLAVIHDHVTPDGRAVAEAVYGDIGPHVPTLEQALDACNGLIVNIEIKNFPRDPAFDPRQRVTDLVIELLDVRGATDNVLISCFDAACLHHVRNRRPDTPTALLMLSRRPAAELLGRAGAEGHSIVHPYDSMVDETFMAAARDRGVAVNVWTGEDETAGRFAQLASLGVDGIITGSPEMALAVVP
jgi:glycerophosphoryl diester phosphodiesterase